MANEKRLIDASKLYEDMMDEYRKANYCDSCLDTTINLIDDAPTVDAVEVVRCKDCKNVQKDELFGTLWCNGTIVKGDYFCASGERKDNG